MKNTNQYKNTCPTASEYQKYLESRGTNRFMVNFRKHLDKCVLCSEAVEGYQNANISNIDNLLVKQSQSFHKSIAKKTSTLFKQVGYAASIALLIGMSVIFTYRRTKKADKKNYTASYYGAVSPQTKKLTKKSNAKYIYLDNCNKIAYNDQLLSSGELKKALEKDTGISLIRIEVSVSDLTCAKKFINNIKQWQTAPVVTISNNYKLKRNIWGNLNVNSPYFTGYIEFEQNDRYAITDKSNFLYQN